MTKRIEKYPEDQRVADLLGEHYDALAKASAQRSPTKVRRILDSFSPEKRQEIREALMAALKAKQAREAKQV